VCRWIVLDDISFVGTVAKGSGRVFVSVPVAYRDLFPVGLRVVVKPLKVDGAVVLRPVLEKKAVGLK